jgi:hypothetical protein
MFDKVLVLTAAASLGMGGVVLQPATALARTNESPDLIPVNYSYCYENPSAATCPGNYDVNRESWNQNSSSRTQSHEPGNMTRHRYLLAPQAH